MGQQGDDKVGGKPGVQQPLSTPWDVAVGVSPGKRVRVSLIVMMMMMMMMMMIMMMMMMMIDDDEQSMTDYVLHALCVYVCVWFVFVLCVCVCVCGDGLIVCPHECYACTGGLW
jgi:hypothetical protein